MLHYRETNLHVFVDASLYVTFSFFKNVGMFFFP